MRNALMALMVSAAMLGVSAPAKADNDTGLIIGGVIGGLILGEALDNHHHHRGRAYYYDEPVYERQCYTRWVNVWSEYRHRWVSRPREVCELVRIQ